ncbi:hypothetical protein K456DRAFT_1602991 [Colletotrichum gloeosporioides 23]|nr:hypothetical protein K456DRAFT_1602991 [Colletotrichum gloeosporioides 23]
MPIEGTRVTRDARIYSLSRRRRRRRTHVVSFRQLKSRGFGDCSTYPRCLDEYPICGRWRWPVVHRHRPNSANQCLRPLFRPFGWLRHGSCHLVTLSTVCLVSNSWDCPHRHGYLSE